MHSFLKENIKILIITLHEKICTLPSKPFITCPFLCSKSIHQKLTDLYLEEKAKETEESVGAHVQLFLFLVTISGLLHKV